MEMVTAVVLGVIQGLTEFLPISSSAHLILVPWILGWNPEGLIFDVSLHFGTAVAILAYFWRDWVELAREVLRGFVEGHPLGNARRKLAWCLAAGTLPAMAVGLAFQKYVEVNLRSPLVTVFTLVGFALVLCYAERRCTQSRSLEDIGMADAVWIGLGQALALIPGVSRSGITISVGLFRNLDRTSAARFSFLLATPVIAGAALLEGMHLAKVVRDPALAAAGGILTSTGAIKWAVLACGTASAVVVGLLCIRYFLRYIQKRSFTPFVLYRILLAAVVLSMFLFHGGSQ